MKQLDDDNGLPDGMGGVVVREGMFMSDACAPSTQDQELAERVCEAIVTQFGPGLADGDKIFFVASCLANERRAERERCVAIVKHWFGGG